MATTLIFLSSTLFSAIALLPQEASAFSLRDPILIIGDGSFTVQNGVVDGSGKWNDPFIVEGWEINASTAHGIEIRDTLAHFVIRNVYVHSGLSDYHGIVLRAPNGRIENSVLSWNRFCVVPSHNTTIVGNDVSHCYNGVFADSVASVEIADNDFYWSSGDGIFVIDSGRVHITDNRGSYGRAAVYLDTSSYAIVENNLFLNNGHGVYISRGSLHEVRNNTIRDSATGIWVDSSHNTITNNSVVTSWSHGIKIQGGIGNSVHHNSLIDNEYQAHDQVGSSQWDDGYPSGGNYWSDHIDMDVKSGPGQDQNGSDGILDSEYVIRGENSVDRYPLVEPPFNDLPTCAIFAPLPGENVTGAVLVNGSAFDSDGVVRKVEVRIDNGAWILAEGNVSWAFMWNTSQFKNGEHEVEVRSFDGTDYSVIEHVNVFVDNPVHKTPILEQTWFWGVIALATVLIVVALLLRRKLRSRSHDQNGEIQEPS